jgi:tetratricopeptide (TPR) repeat protein
MNADRDEQLGALFKRGYALVDKGRFAEAKPIFEACLWFGPHPQYDVAIRQELARVLRELGDLEGALALRLDAKSLQPDRHAKPVETRRSSLRDGALRRSTEGG